jgi:hypothetical protein
MTNFSNVAILVGDITNVDKIKNYISKFPNAQIFTLNFKSHLKLSEQKIPHIISENFLQDQDYDKIDLLSKNASINWYKHDKIKKFLKFEEINLGNLLEQEFHQYILPFFTNAFTIEYIVINNNFKKIISITEINPFVEEICKNNNIEFIQIDKKQNSSLVLDKLNIKINLGKMPISLNISRKQYLFFKKHLEKILFSFLGLKYNQINKKSILLLDFNPILYEDLLIQLSKLDKEIILLNTRRPAVWNFKSFQIILQNKCKLISLSEYEKNISENMEYREKLFFDKLNELWKNDDVLKEYFSINSQNLWSSIKESFKQICYTRFSESIRKIFMINELFDTINPSIILEWAEIAFEEKMLIPIAKKFGIEIIYLQHALAAMEDSNKFHGRFISHLSHPFLSHKQAVWGNSSKEYAILNNNPHTIAIGSPRHDKFFNFKENSKNKGLILFAPTFPSNISSKNMSTESITNFNNFIQQTCRVLSNLPNKEFLVKPHPTVSSVYDITKLVKEVDPTISITYDDNILNLINKCELLITTNNSTIAIDAIMLKKPVISLQTSSIYLENELVKMNALLYVTKISDIESTIKKILIDSELKQQLLEKSKHFLNRHFTNQGNASEKLANLLDKF